MVSLEERFSYIKSINESMKLTAFYNLLFSSSIVSPNQFSNETEEIFFGIIQSIKNDNKTDFELYYKKKSRSNPSQEYLSPFVNDDFLIFCLIIGITKFNIDRGWIKSIINIRNRNPITITIENILNENYFSRENLFELVLVFLYLTNYNLISNDILNLTYKRIIENTNLFESKNDIEIICSIRSFDLIINYKEATDGNEIKLLRDFNVAFIKRIKILVWLIQTIVIVLILWIVVNLLEEFPHVKTFLESYNFVFKILALFGISQIANIFPIIKNAIHGFVYKIFGYPRMLNNIDNKK